MRARAAALFVPGSPELAALELRDATADVEIVVLAGPKSKAMLLAAWLVYAIEGRFLAAAGCTAIAALLSWFGVIHAWQFSRSDTVMELGWGAGQAWAEGYAAITVIVLLARWLQRRRC